MNINAVSTNFTGMLRIKNSECDKAINTNNISSILTDQRYAGNEYTNIYYATPNKEYVKIKVPLDEVLSAYKQAVDSGMATIDCTHRN